MKSILLLILALSPILSAATRVACVGDSITFGVGIPQRERLGYPAQLQKMLGGNFEVKNFGVNGATMLKAGDHPYTAQPSYQQSLEYAPNIVIIMLGANDSKAINWNQHGQHFLADTLALIRSYQSLESAPRIILCTPLPAYAAPHDPQSFGIRGDVIAAQQIPLIIKATTETGVECVHLHQEFSLEGSNKAVSMLTDSIHPNPAGAETIAKRLRFQLNRPVDMSYSIASKLAAAGISARQSSFHYYRQYLFTPPGTQLSCIIVAPHNTAAHKPWIWRANFSGEATTLDRALLDRGYHLVYCDTAGLYGSPLALKRWDFTYALTQTLGLSPKPILEGMGPDGLVIFNWAKHNPDKVTAIYGDNPACDIRSWPKEASKADWQRCLEAYGITEKQAKNFNGNPIDGLEKLAVSQVPIMLVLGAKDKVIPNKDNALALSKQYRKLGGKYVQIWINPNTGHLPYQTCPIRALLDYTLAAANLNQKKAVVLPE